MLKNNNNNNNNMDFIPFKLDSFNLSDLKSILYKYYYFENNPDVNIDLIQP
jgi:hypothetical protein